MDAKLDNLIRRMARLPGLGPRSARRAVLHLLQNRERLMLPLAEDLGQVAHTIRNCAECANLDTGDICSLCRDPQRDDRRSVLSRMSATCGRWSARLLFRGLYHVLGGTLSAIDGRGPSELNIDRLLTRAGQTCRK